MASDLLPGIIPPLISPLTDRLDPDRESLTRLIDHVIEGGVSGIFLLGSTGEGASLDSLSRQKLVDAALEANSARVPVLLNISTSSFLETLRLAEYAADSGVDFVVLSPPCYFPMSQEELSSYFLKIAERAELPLLLYNAVLREDIKELPRLLDLKKRVHDSIYHVPDSPMGIVMGLKYALSVRGISAPAMAMPVYGALSDIQKRNIGQFTLEMADLGF